jgi:hypothetical protein
LPKLEQQQKSLLPLTNGVSVTNSFFFFEEDKYAEASDPVKVFPVWSNVLRVRLETTRAEHLSLTREYCARQERHARNKYLVICLWQVAFTSLFDIS